MHQVQVQNLSSPTYIDPEQHYVNNFDDNNMNYLLCKKSDESEQFYELIDGEDDEEQNLKMNYGLNSNLSLMKKSILERTRITSKQAR